jgi:hypothetical protein
MFKDLSRIKPLQLRKQLLIVESEINRVQVLKEWGMMAAEVRGLGDHMKSMGTLSSAVALFGVGLSAFRNGQAAPADPKPSWLQTALKVTQLAGDLWLAHRARP